MVKTRQVLDADRTGAFNMDIVGEILEFSDISAAKTKAKEWLKTIDNARVENIRKAESMIDNSKTVKSLAMAMSNFILAFQGLAVIK